MKKLKETWQNALSHAGLTAAFTVCAFLLALLLLFHIILNALPMTLTHRDVSSGKMYTLSDTSKSKLKDVNTDVWLYAVMDHGADTTQIMTFLSRYAALNDHIHVACLDKTDNAAFLNEYGAANATSGSVLVETPYRHTMIDSSSFVVACNNDLGLAVPYTEYANQSGSYGGPYYYNETVGVLTYMQYVTYGAYYMQNGYQFEELHMDMGFIGEENVTDAVLYCLVADPAHVYTFAGHEAESLSDNIVSVLAQALVDVKTWDPAVSSLPDDCDILMLLGPVTDLSAAETEQIFTYVEKGGKLLLTTSPEYVASQTNLTTALAAYGMVPDLNGINFVVENSMDHVLNPYYPYVILADCSSHRLLSDVSSYSILMPMASEILTNADDTRISALYLTSELAYNVYPTVTGTDGSPLSGEAGVKTVGAVLEEENGGAIVYIGSSGLFDESVINNNAGNFYHLVGFIGGLTDVPQSEEINVQAAVMSTRLAVPMTTVIILATVLVIVIPVVILTVGLVRIRRRQRA